MAVAHEPRLLADAVLRLASDAAERARLRGASVALIKRMSWPTIADAHVDVYERLLYSAP